MEISEFINMKSFSLMFHTCTLETAQPREMLRNKDNRLLRKTNTISWKEHWIQGCKFGQTFCWGLGQQRSLSIMKQMRGLKVLISSE